jgi:amidase
MCLRPGGLPIVKEVEAAVLDAGRRLADAGWQVEEIEDVPSLHEAASVQERLWLGDGFAELSEAAARDGDPGALAVVSAFRSRAATFGCDVVARALLQRATVTREWRLFLAEHPVLLLPVSAELPFPDGLDLEGETGFWRVWKALLVQRGLPAMGLPGLTVSTNLIGTTPVGVRRRSLPGRSVFAHGQGDRGSRYARRPDRSHDNPGEGRDRPGCRDPLLNPSQHRMQ